MSDPDFRVGASVRVDRKTLNRVVDDWYRKIAARGGIPAPGRRHAVSAPAAAAYTAGIADLLARAAAATGTPVADLYRVNRGRIPPWAWHRPYQRIAGMATPVPAVLRPDPRSGGVRLSLRGVLVTILPDGYDPAQRGSAQTRSLWQPGATRFSYESRGGTDQVVSVTQDPPSVTVQTFYGPDVGPDQRAGYGRGTLPEDLAGAAVHPWSGSVAFHEGQHGMDVTEFLKLHPPPAFAGRPGLTVPRFQAALRQWNEDWRAYETRADAFSHARTDNVGFSYDEYQRTKGRRLVPGKAAQFPRWAPLRW